MLINPERTIVYSGAMPKTGTTTIGKTLRRMGWDGPGGHTTAAQARRRWGRDVKLVVSLRHHIAWRQSYVNHVRRSRMQQPLNHSTREWLEWLTGTPWVDDEEHYDRLLTATYRWPVLALNPVLAFDPIRRPYLEEQPHTCDLYEIMRRTFHGNGLVDQYLFTEEITTRGDEMLGLPPGTFAETGVRNRHEDRLAKIIKEQAEARQ